MIKVEIKKSSLIQLYKHSRADMHISIDVSFEFELWISLLIYIYIFNKLFILDIFNIKIKNESKKRY